MKRKIIALFLSAAMVFSQSSAVFAQEPETISEFTENGSEESDTGDMQPEEMVMETQTAEEWGMEEVSDMVSADSDVVFSDSDAFFSDSDAVSADTEDFLTEEEIAAEISAGEIQLEAAEESEVFLGDLSDAEDVTFGSEITDTIPIIFSSPQYYRLTLPKSGRITIRTTAWMKSVLYSLHNAEGTQLYSTKPIWDEITMESTKVITLDLTKGVYYFCVKKDGTYFGDYSFTVSYTSANETFEETGTGVNNQLNQAAGISIDKTYVGQIAANDDRDFYKLTIPSSGKVKLDATARMASIVYQVYDSNGVKHWSSNADWDPSSKTSVRSYEIDLTQGTYYLGVIRNGYTGTYYFKCGFTSAEESFPESGTGTNNSIATANAIALNVPYRGQLAYNDLIDYYKFQLISDTVIRLSATSSGIAEITYKIYNAAGETVYTADGEWDETTRIASVERSVSLVKGTYYLSAQNSESNNMQEGSTPVSCCGNYSFKIMGNLAAPTLNSLKNVENGVYFSWGAVPGANRYRVLRKVPGGSWISLGSTTANSIVDKSAVNGTTYLYSVGCVSDDGKRLIGDVNARGKQITYYAAPVLNALKLTQNGIQVSWGKLSTAGKYRVYRKSGTGNWVAIADTTLTNYTDYKVVSGTTYTYTVRAMNGAGTVYMGAFSTAGKSTLFLSAPKVNSLSLEVDGVKVAFEKVNGAAKYRVFRKTPATSWMAIADTAGTSYIDKSAVSGTAYSYTVRCITSGGQSYTSACDTIGKSITYVAAPKITLSKAFFTGNINIKWDAVGGASNYRIFRKVTGGSWQILTDTTSTGFTDKTAVKGTTYMYTVRALSTDGTRCISSFYNPGGTITR